jgi:hypothetical protein
VSTVFQDTGWINSSAPVTVVGRNSSGSECYYYNLNGRGRKNLLGLPCIVPRHRPEGILREYLLQVRIHHVVQSTRYD